MIYFIQAKYYDMIIYEHAWIFVNNYFKFGLLGISYNAIMHKCRFGLAYCINLL
jgi:hypothetical protein